MVGRLSFGDECRKHGMYKHPTYSVWSSMKSRCNRPKDKAWPNYGGRGIKVCVRWQDFAEFWKDMGPTYKPGLTLERRKNDKNYCPSNCYWATRSQQQQNRRCNKILQTPWGPMCMTEACRRSGIGWGTIRRRLESGWPSNVLFVAPDRQNRYHPNLKRRGCKGVYV